jgi:transposase
MKSRRKFDKQFKIDAVKLLERSGKTISEIADDLGIEPYALSRWRQDFTKNKEKAFPGEGNPRDEELFRLKKELADVTMERDILKKAVAIFSKTEKRGINS